MVRFYNLRHPGKRSAFQVFQLYAWQYYLGLAMALLLILLYQLAQRGAIFIPGLLGVFATVLLSNALAGIQMQRTKAEVGFHEGHFYIRNVYQVALGQEAEFFPLPYANAQLQGDTLTVTYFDTIHTLKEDEWRHWDDLLYYFGFRWFH
jgi:hypothetical protein